MHSFLGHTVLRPRADTTIRPIIPFKGIIGSRGGRRSEGPGVSSTTRATKATIESRTLKATKISTIQQHTTHTDIYNESLISSLSTKTYNHLTTTTHDNNDNSDALITSNNICDNSFFGT